jgi:glycosyltransferase involved in cell wall biosynthesis
MPPEIPIAAGADTSLVTIAMSVRNNARTLATTIRSILDQTYTHWELLLIDDGSTDGTLEIARSFTDPRITVISDGKARGLAERLNEAIDLSAGTYFARMDGDDIAYPQRLERQVAYLEAHPDVDLAAAWVVTFGADGVALGKRMNAERHEEICAHPAFGIALPHPTWVGRLGFFQYYRYKTSAVMCQDVDLLLRAYRHARFATVPEVLLGYREERLQLKKLLWTRGYHVRSIVQEFVRQGEPGLAVKGAAMLGVKAMVDCVAVTTGLNYRLLRHRALPMSADEQREWREIWDRLHAPVAVPA